MPAPWTSWKKILSCKQDIDCTVYDPKALARVGPPDHAKLHAQLYNSQASRKRRAVAAAGTGCSHSCHSIRHVIHGNTRVVHRGDSESPSLSVTSPHPHKINKLDLQPTFALASQNSNPASLKPLSLQGKKRAGCYDCSSCTFSVPPHHQSPQVLDKNCASIPVQVVCSKCGDQVSKAGSLEDHDIIFHAVMELREGDSARNIVEIIFETSWLRMDIPCGRPQRIFKVLNSQNAVTRFEEYRSTVKAKASKHNTTRRHSRCLADGNELLRFYGTSVVCSLAKPWPSSTSLCTASTCGVCGVLRNGFKGQSGIYTNASTGRAHDSALIAGNGDRTQYTHGHRGVRAMLVCRVIAGRVKRKSTQNWNEGPSVGLSGYDSLAGQGGPYSSVEELVVLNARAVLPCFVVIYSF